MLIKVREATFGFCENLSPKLRDYSTRMGSWLPALAATTNQPFGMHFKHVHVLTSSPCLPPFLGPMFILTPKWESDFDLGIRKKVPFVHAIWQPLLLYSLCLWCNVLEVLNLYFTCNLMWYIYVTPCPNKKRWCLHHVLCLFCFFAGLSWNSSMVSWACSISDSFTQDASIGWYPFHLTKYSCSRPLNCLDLSTTSISNSGSLWT